MPTHKVKKKIVEVEGVEFLETTATYITLTPKEDLEVMKVEEDKKKVKDEKKLKDIDDEIKMFNKKVK